jgi:hypothetical protein
MQSGFTTIPFKMDDNLSQISGVGKFSAAGIILEYEGKIFGLIKSGVKEARIALDEILDVKFHKGVFKRGAKIEIRLKSFAKLSEVPNRNGKITLKLERGDYEPAEEAVSRLQKDLTEHQENLPPVQTPVRKIFDDDENSGKTN